MRAASIALVFVASTLAGCAGMQRVDSDVQAYSTLAARPQNASYRFDRLPSQLAADPRRQAAQAQVEAAAERALARAGLVRAPDDASRAPTYAVQVQARAQRVLEEDPFFDRWGPWGGARGWSVGRGWPLAGGPYAWRDPFYGPFGPGYWPPRTSVQREVALVMRDLASNRVVYETHAVNETGTGGDSATMLGAMFEAALRDFPQAVQGRRSVDLAPAGAAPAATPAVVAAPPASR